MNLYTIKANTTNFAIDVCYASSDYNYPRPILSKKDKETAGDKLVVNGNTTHKGALPMQSQIQINNTKYIIERSFKGVKTPAMLIEERVFNDKSKNVPLTQQNEMRYSNSSGSVQN